MRSTRRRKLFGIRSCLPLRIFRSASSENLPPQSPVTVLVSRSCEITPPSYSNESLKFHFRSDGSIEIFTSSDVDHREKQDPIQCFHESLEFKTRRMEENFLSEGPEMITNIKKLLDVGDHDSIQRFLNRSQNPKVLYSFLEVVAQRSSDKHLSERKRKDASFYFTSYATEGDPDNILVLALLYLEYEKALTYIPYCTRGGWKRAMRVALNREDENIIRCIWDVPERPRNHPLTKILISYMKDLEDPKTCRDEESSRIPLPSFLFLLNLVNQKEGYILVSIQEAAIENNLPSIYDLIDKL